MADNQLVFVIHKHKATSLHYDFRLEIGGVMSSWSIPKGPTLDNTLKRLAMPTDNHDLEYRHFEGVLQEDAYDPSSPLTPKHNAPHSPVMIWDTGYYIPEIEIEKGLRKEITNRTDGEKVMEEGLAKGEIKFFLLGKKLQGSFALVRTKGWGPKDSWLLIKHKDEYVQKDYDANDYPKSSVSGKSLEEIKKEG
jgi:bifunctional non-homologous end joining protein LigD